MSDYLVDLGTNRRARTVIKNPGLPVPLPENAVGRWPWCARPLEGASVAVGGTCWRTARRDRKTAASGATTLLVGLDEAASAFAEAAEAFARPYRGVDAVPDDERVRALVFDASEPRRSRNSRACGLLPRERGPPRAVWSGRVLSRVPRAAFAGCSLRPARG